MAVLRALQGAWSLRYAAIACAAVGCGVQLPPPPDDVAPEQQDDDVPTPGPAPSGGGIGPADPSTAATPRTAVPVGAPRGPRIAFVTSVELLVDEVGGITGADRRCNDLANASTKSNVRGRKFIAWLSDENMSARSRLSDGTFIRPDEQRIADDLAGLTTGPLHRAIDIDENGASRGGTTWTGTRADGERTSATCTSFATLNASRTDYGTVGSVRSTSGTWTDDGQRLCTKTEQTGAADGGVVVTQIRRRLYCFEE